MRTMVLAMGAAAALAAPAGALAAGPPFMGGLTSQHEPVVFKLSSDARTVLRANVALDLRCSDGGSFTFPDDYERMPVSRRGRFNARFDTGPFDDGGGLTGRLRGSLHGRVRHAGREVSGTWSLTLADTDAQGTTTNTCRSGAVRFDVRR